MASERRQHDRYRTTLNLEVFDRYGGQRLGRIVDLSRDGFMLVTEQLLAADSVWECRLTSGSGEVREVLFGADCLWSRPGTDEHHGWAGFHIIDIGEDQAVLLDSLLQGL
ncbi:PilZ domain-containing protein [Pseudomonas sp.]|uniref:PilZ domain-containing protein n=1 Tax=Pseudomonas sp. TaxID=306 RepID=UPI0028B17E30|nr:PilZ domain-containing protein [Pseudomonas sp.]